MLTGVAAITIFALFLAYLLVAYGTPETNFQAIAASVAYSALLFFSVYHYWSVMHYLKASGARIVIALLVQLASVAGSVLVLAIIDSSSLGWFYKTLPLVLPFGTLCWISIILWYSLTDCKADREVTELPAKRVDANIMENIPVKEGNKMHIVRAERLHYVQAYGDYVMLFTENGKFIKEETMKHFETTLPEYFVRIHRSAIVNTRTIVRTELYGKESYTIYLSSGVTLRASASGYRLLKEKLSLDF